MQCPDVSLAVGDRARHPLRSSPICAPAPANAGAVRRPRAWRGAAHSISPCAPRSGLGAAAAGPRPARCATASSGGAGSVARLWGVFFPRLSSRLLFRAPPGTPSVCAADASRLPTPPTAVMRCRAPFFVPRCPSLSLCQGALPAVPWAGTDRRRCTTRPPYPPSRPPIAGGAMAFHAPPLPLRRGAPPPPAFPAVSPRQPPAWPRRSAAARSAPRAAARPSPGGGGASNPLASYGLISH